jgi:hypothetical protein
MQAGQMLMSRILQSSFGMQFNSNSSSGFPDPANHREYLKKLPSIVWRPTIADQARFGKACVPTNKPDVSERWCRGV